MSALAQAYDAQKKDGELVSYPVAANTSIFKGSLVAVVAGFVVPAADAAGAAFVGVAHETKINTASTPLPGQAGQFAGAAGALSIRVEKTGSYVYAKPGAVAADRGKQAFVVDSGTVATAATANNVACGHVVDVPDLGHVRVRIDRGVQ